MDIKQLIEDLEEIRQECSDKMTDLDEVEEKLAQIINELAILKRRKKCKPC